MVKIVTYVFFDIETTGLPHEERNGTKITELCFVVASRTGLEQVDIGTRPSVRKLTLLFNPQRKVSLGAASITGLTNDKLKYKPTFKEKVETIVSFLSELPKPVCLIAHNGNRFDYKVLLAEFKDINMSLPNDLLCADSLVGFRRLHKEKYPRVLSTSNNSFEDMKESEDWPELDLSSEDWNEIDLLCSSFSEIDPFGIPKSPSSKCVVKKEKKVNDKLSFKLTDLYERLLNKKVTNSHRAEDDCMILLDCVIAAKEFLIWADKYCKSISDIKPLERYA